MLLVYPFLYATSLNMFFSWISLFTIYGVHFCTCMDSMYSDSSMMQQNLFGARAAFQFSWNWGWFSCLIRCSKIRHADWMLNFWSESLRTMFRFAIHTCKNIGHTFSFYSNAVRHSKFDVWWHFHIPLHVKDKIVLTPIPINMDTGHR